MHDHNGHGGFGKSGETWRAVREAKRAAWRARRAARHARSGDWSRFGDPKFWGLDAASCGMGGAHAHGQASAPPSEVAELKTKVAAMEKLIASMSERLIVLEKLAVDDERRLAAEIEKLRGMDGGRA